MHVARILADDPALRASALRLPQQPQTPFPILSAKLKLTWRCNLRCTACGLWRRAAADPDHADLPLERGHALLDDLHAQGLRKVHFSGGEVLLVPGFVDMLRHARRLNLQVNLTTNGTLLDGDMVRELLRQRAHTVNVSIDSHEPAVHDEMRGVTGAWRATVKGLERLRRKAAEKERWSVVAVNTVITRNNIDHLNDTYTLLTDLGVRRWRLLPIDTPEAHRRPTAEQWQVLFDRLPQWQPLLTRFPVHLRPTRPEKSARLAHKGRYAGDFFGERRCFAPWYNLFVDANGAAFPCCMAKNRIPTYGNIAYATLRDLLGSRSRRETLQQMAAGHVFDVCHECDDFLEENDAFERLHTGANPPDTMGTLELRDL